MEGHDGMLYACVYVYVSYISHSFESTRTAYILSLSFSVSIQVQLLYYLLD